METLAKFARAGDRIISFAAAVLMLLMFCYGGYSLWDTAMTNRGAFASKELLKFKPSSGAAESPTLAELQKINPDVRGWLTIEDTHIDYPVVQGKNDMDYINKDVYGDFSLSGSIFMDSRNCPDFSDAYCLVYGHHMANGGMFGDVTEFVNASWFENHPAGILYLPEKTYKITLFACVEVDAFDRVIYNPTIQEKGRIGELLAYIREIAVQYRDIGIREEDSVIGLSTCAESATNGRVVLFGRLDKSE